MLESGSVSIGLPDSIARSHPAPAVPSLHVRHAPEPDRPARDRPGVTQGELAEHAGVLTCTARRHLTELVGEGTVLSEEDGRAHCYWLADRAQPAASAPVLTEAEFKGASRSVVSRGAARATTASTRSKIEGSAEPPDVG